MMSSLTNLNWLGIMVAFLVYFILGAVWFTLLFAKSYKVSLGREDETLAKAPIFIVGPALCTFVITVTTAVLMHALDIHTAGDALELALLIGLGYLGANTVNIAINPNIPRPLHYGMISGSYHLVGISLVMMILWAMR